MTSSLPQDVRTCFERFITTEYTTIDARQQPITWPVTPYYQPGGPSIDVTTGLGYPKKADDARRNPHVALLFSDPTGAGIEEPIQVLVQGTADVDESDLDANKERYWRESWEKLPGARDAHPPKVLRGLFGWYYTRIYVKVRPERVFVWADGDVSKEPEVHDSHLEEVRSGHSQEPLEAHEPKIGGPVTWDERMDELGARHPTAVLSWVGPDGFPLAVRTPVAVDRDARRVGLERTGRAPAGRGARVPHGACARPQLQLAGELPGPRRPRPRQRRLDACAAPPLGRVRAPRRERAGALPPQLLEDDPLLPQRPPAAPVGLDG